MSVLIQVNNISKNYGVRKLLDEASVAIGAEQKIGVIGRNGAGKSTLCKILIGEDNPDSGEIVRNSNLKLSYLEQHDPFELGETIIDFLTRYTGKEEWECGEMAAHFLIPYDMLYQTVGSVSGGFQTRVKLTAMLLKDPNFLILDEPSNYLDLSTLILLEHFLVNFRGGYLVVSHDREFLKRTCEHTLEVEHGKTTIYPGNVEDYFEFKEEQLRQKMAFNKGVEKKRAELQAFADRFRAKASTASRAKSKLKQIEKLKTIEVRHPMSSVKIQIPAVESKAGVALVCEDLVIGYPEKEVAKNIRFQIDRGSHVAVLGDNGQGKTTFFKTIADELQPLGGNFKWASALSLGHYAQHVFQKLHPEDDIVAHLQREAADGVTRQDILDMAGCFLFQGDDVKKKVKVLSGGERARLCLAGLLLSRCQVLLLDEPTNHLDFETVEALARALRTYAGTVFFISHDRTFVNLVATHILEVKDGKILRYPGTYEDYVYHLEMRAQQEDFNSAPKKPDSQKGATGPQSERSEKRELKKEEEDSKKSKSDLKKVKAEITKLKIKINKMEVRVENLKVEKEAIIKEMAENPFNYSPQRNDKLKQVTISLEEEEDNLIKLMEKLEKLEKKKK